MYHNEDFVWQSFILEKFPLGRNIREEKNYPIVVILLDEISPRKTYARRNSPTEKQECAKYPRTK